MYYILCEFSSYPKYERLFTEAGQLIFTISQWVGVYNGNTGLNELSETHGNFMRFIFIYFRISSTETCIWEESGL